MVAEQHTVPGPVEIDPALLGRLGLGTIEVPYADLEDEPRIHMQLVLRGDTYTYQRTFPIKGHSAVMPAAVAELLDAGKQVLVVERGGRYYVYAA